MPVLSLSSFLFIAVSNPAFTEVVWREFNRYAVALQDFDVVHPHLAGNMSENFVAVFSFTRNVALGNASSITPSTLIAPCFAILTARQRMELFQVISIKY